MGRGKDVKHKPSSEIIKVKGKEQETIGPPRQTFVQKYSSCRWIFAYVSFLGRLLQGCNRASIGMSVVCMTRRSLQHSDLTHWSSNASYSYNISNSTTVPYKTGEFSWSENFDGIVFSSFYYGYLVTPIFSGYICGRFSAKWVVALAMLVTGVANILTPVSVRSSYILLVILRVIIGLATGFIAPALETMVARWVPRTEKAQISTLAFTGNSVGTVLAFLLSGILCEIPVDNGWPFIYYAFGSVSLLWLLLWLFLVYDSPQVHPRIREDEQKVISFGTHHEPAHDKITHPPWIKILTSLPFWAILIAHVSYAWVSAVALHYLPTYFRDVLHFDVKEDGLISSIPFMWRFIVEMVCAFLSDRLINNGLLKTGSCRKLFQLVGSLSSSLGLVAIAFLDDHNNRILVIVLQVFSLSIRGTCMSGFKVNHLDIAPRFAGLTNGITLTVATVTSIVSPLVTPAIVQNRSQAEWQIVFLICAGVSCFGAVFFVILGDGEEQEWAKFNKELEISVISPDPQLIISEKNNNEKPKHDQLVFISEKIKPRPVEVVRRRGASFVLPMDYVTKL